MEMRGLVRRLSLATEWTTLVPGQPPGGGRREQAQRVPVRAVPA